MLSPSQRKKRAIILKKSLSKRLRSKKQLQGKMPPKEVLKKRALILARKKAIIKYKLLPPEMMSLYPSGLSISQKMSIEKKLNSSEIQPKIRKLIKSAYRLVVRKAQEQVRKHKLEQEE